MSIGRAALVSGESAKCRAKYPRLFNVCIKRLDAFAPVLSVIMGALPQFYDIVDLSVSLHFKEEYDSRNPQDIRIKGRQK